MPRGTTHELWANLLALPLSYLYYKFSHSLSDTSIFFFSFVFATFMLSPDLDTKSKSYSRWGIMRFIWIPYRKFMKHRNFLSHFPVISSAIRGIYLILSLIILFSVISYIILLILSFGSSEYKKGFFDVLKATSIMTAKTLLSIKKEYILAMFSGLFHGDTIHYLLDIFTSKIKSSTR